MKPTVFSHKLFDECVKPVLERSSIGSLSTICAGCFMPETEILRMSSDIDTGDDIPTIQIILFEQTSELANKLTSVLQTGLPDVFEDHHLIKIGSESTKKTVEVYFWQDLLYEMISLKRRPTDPLGYSKVSESQFYALLAGKIFWDPELELSRAQGQWDHMPQEVWYWRHHWVWKNILPRITIAKRLETDTSGMAKLSTVKRVEWAIRLAFMTARKYCPPQPMMLNVLRTINDYGGIAEKLSWCLSTGDSFECLELCDEILIELRNRLAHRQIIPFDLGNTETNNSIDTTRVSDYFLRLVPSNFRSQAGRVCPIDLLGSLAQSAKYAP
jgi:hypothetical protein